MRSFICIKCGTEKRRLKNGALRCAPCTSRRSREYYHESAQRRHKQRRRYVVRRYGKTFEELEQLLAAQGGCCGICRRPWSECRPAKPIRHERTFLALLTVDHDHRTGAVRGLLCNACNTGIGIFEEDIGRFYRAAAYLRLHGVPFADHVDTPR